MQAGDRKGHKVENRLKLQVIINLNSTFTDVNGISWTRSTQLKDLLNPKSFAKRDEKGEIREYCYGVDREGNYLGDEVAISEMRKTVGIAMEYLEKWQQWDKTEKKKG